MDYDQFEDDLRQQKPAVPPADLMRKLRRARPVGRPAQRQAAPALPRWSLLMRWLIPATAVAAAAFLVWRWQVPLTPALGGQTKAGEHPAVTADDVEIQQELVSAFDTVARLPSGEPVRFRCREWMDEVILRDKERGVEIEQRAPRVEVVPVRFETY